MKADAGARRPLGHGYLGAIDLAAVNSALTGFEALYGLEVTELSDGLVRSRVAVRDEVKQPAGLLHGGVIAAVAEGTTSMATHIAVAADGRAAMGLSNQTSFLRPVTEGHLNARAQARHRGRTTWIWDVEFTDDEGRLCALSRMTIAVRPAPGA